MIGCSRGSVSIGDRCLIGTGTIIGAGNGRTVIGSDIFIGPYCVLSGGGDITLGNESMIASHARVYSSEHTIDGGGMAMSRLPVISKGVTIGWDVWIGSGATVLDGASIAEGCVIGAGAVLKGKTDERSIYVGVPARKVRARKQTASPENSLGHVDS
jgi:acetyltransferase-like isoleucine patch superfamily enzyme